MDSFQPAWYYHPCARAQRHWCATRDQLIALLLRSALWRDTPYKNADFLQLFTEQDIQSVSARTRLMQEALDAEVARAKMPKGPFVYCERLVKRRRIIPGPSIMVARQERHYDVWWRSEDEIFEALSRLDVDKFTASGAAVLASKSLFPHEKITHRYRHRPTGRVFLTAAGHSRQAERYEAFIRLCYGTQELDDGQVFQLSGARHYVTWEQTDASRISTGCIRTVPDDARVVKCSVCEASFLSSGHWHNHATKRRHGREARAIPEAVDGSPQTPPPLEALDLQGDEWQALPPSDVAKSSRKGKKGPPPPEWQGWSSEYCRTWLKTAYQKAQGRSEDGKEMKNSKPNQHAVAGAAHMSRSTFQAVLRYHKIKWRHFEKEMQEEFLSLLK